MWSTHNGARRGEAPNQPSRMAVDDVRRTDMRARKYSTDPTADHLRDDGFWLVYRLLGAKLSKNAGTETLPDVTLPPM